MKVVFVVKTQCSEETYTSWTRAVEAQNRHWSNGTKAEVITRYEATKRR